MARDPSAKRRVSLTKTQGQAGVGAELLALCQSITEDGSISKEEILALRAWLKANKNSDLPAVEFLTTTVEEIVEDRRVTNEEIEQLYESLVRVLPPEWREEAQIARDIAKDERTSIGAAPHAYENLAKRFRKQERFDAEVRTLERCLKMQNANPYYENLTGGEWTARIQEDLTQAKIRLEGYERYGLDGKGQCEECGKEPRKLSRIETGQWVCVTCKKQLCPRRPAHLASESQLKYLRQLGFKVSDELTRDRGDRILELHRLADYYVCDVWEALTGNRATYQLGQRNALDRFVTSLFRDVSLVERIAAVQHERQEMAYSRMTEEELSDPHRYAHLARTKPAIERDEDFAYVAQRLRQEYPQFIKQ